MLVDCALYEDGQRLPLPSELGSLGELDAHPAAFAWAGLQFPQPDELSEVARLLGIAEHVDVAPVSA